MLQALVALFALLPLTSAGAAPGMVFLLEMILVIHLFSLRQVHGRPGAQACHALASPHATPSLCWTVAAALPPSPVPCLFAMLLTCACVCKKFSAWQVNKGPRQVDVRCQKKTRRREAIRRRRQALRHLRALRCDNKTRSMRALMLLPFISTWLLGISFSGSCSFRLLVCTSS